MVVFPAGDMGIRNPVIVVPTDVIVFVGGSPHLTVFLYDHCDNTVSFSDKLVSCDFV